MVGSGASSGGVPGSAAGGASDYDAVIVGASLAGCAAAIGLGRAGARVALVEQRPGADAFKRICTHYIQSSAVGALERLGLLEPMLQAGAVRSRTRVWTRWGWIEPAAESRVPSGVNLRRERMDPLIRGIAAETPGVELILGHTVDELLRDGDRVAGVRARDRNRASVMLRARLVVGADGRSSRVAKLAGVATKTYAHGRFAYGGYFEGPLPDGFPNGSMWLQDPHVCNAMPTDSGLIFYGCMPAKEHLPEFRRDPTKATIAFVAGVHEAPPILASRLVEPVTGKLDMTNVAHAPTAPGLALVGDAALAVDPAWGVGCGWAVQSAEWLADSVAPALRDGDPAQLARGLKRYRRRHGRELMPHARMICDSASGRRFNLIERGLYKAAPQDERLAATLEAFASRNIDPLQMLVKALPRAARINTRNRLAGPAARPAPGSVVGVRAGETP